MTIVKSYLRETVKIAYTIRREKDIMFHSFRGSRSKIAIALMAAIFAITAPSSSVLAQDTPCDPKYYESLEARAWLEAQREITQNQNLIYKPDSVLEYTCYVGHLNILAKLTTQDRALFSATGRWGTTEPGNMTNSLQSLVGSAMQKYAANFPGNLLGGRSNRAQTLSGTSVSPGDYSCDVMQAIWTEAKCKNFIDRDHDGFFTFEEYSTGSDKRELPAPCSGSPPWTTNINTATESPPWTREDVKTYYDELFPVSSDCGSGHVSHVKTGLKVIDTLSGGPTEYDEHVCVVPGCRWEPTSATAGTCQKPPAPSAGGSGTPPPSP